MSPSRPTRAGGCFRQHCSVIKTFDYFWYYYLMIIKWLLNDGEMLEWTTTEPYRDFCTRWRLMLMSNKCYFKCFSDPPHVHESQTLAKKILRVIAYASFSVNTQSCLIFKYYNRSLALTKSCDGFMYIKFFWQIQIDTSLRFENYD